MRAPKVTVIINITSLAAGGSENDVTLLANYWARNGRRVILATHDNESIAPFFPLHPSVQSVRMADLGKYRSLLSTALRNLQRIERLRKLVIEARPECVIAYGETNAVRAVMATLGLGIPVIISERSHPAYLTRTVHGWIWRGLSALCYPLADALVVLNEKYKNVFHRAVQRKTVVIPVGLAPDILEDLGSSRDHVALPEKTIAAMGRMVWEKRFDLLLRSFSIVAGKRDSRLVIFGDGPLRPELEALTSELGLTGRVDMPGFVKRPWRILKDAYVFVLSSEVEAMGNVMVEALACGVPVVAFDCPDGPREVVRPGVDGFLTPPLDVAALAEAIIRLLDNKQERDRLAARAVEARERFAPHKIAARWDDLIERARRKRGYPGSSDTASGMPRN
jgi:glycosyltransferase involved in cell wall biosynthesis